MTAPAQPEARETLIKEWRATGYPYKVIAAEIAEWAAGRERGTVPPDDLYFEMRHGIEASASTYRRAKRFLVTQGVLVNDGYLTVA
jgi:hypothetical protein